MPTEVLLSKCLQTGLGQTDLFYLLHLSRYSIKIHHLFTLKHTAQAPASGPLLNFHSIGFSLFPEIHSPCMLNILKRLDL